VHRQASDVSDKFDRERQEHGHGSDDFTHILVLEHAPQDARLSNRDMLESQRPSGSETHLTPATHSKKPKVLSSTEITKRAQQFAAKWKGASQENAEAQSWWNDFFAVFGVDRYSTATFERWARRASTGRRGRIDVFVPGLMIAEHKSLGRDLSGAENQADDYLAGGEIGAQ